MILLVDDDPVFLEQAEAILNSDRRIFLASDAKHALELIEAVGFSVALVDLDLPDQKGLELIRKIRAISPDLPIIAISGAFSKNALESAKLLGVVDVLSKPAKPEWKAAVERIRKIGLERKARSSSD